MKMNRMIRSLGRTVGLRPAGSADYIMPAIGILAVGMAVGAGVALLFAPTTGKKLREEVEHKFSDLRSRLLLEQGGNGSVTRNRSAADQSSSRIGIGNSGMGGMGST